DPRAPRGALRERLQGDQCRGDAAGARLVRRATARDCRRCARGYRFATARRSARACGQRRLPDRRGGSRAAPGAHRPWHRAGRRRHARARCPDRCLGCRRGRRRAALPGLCLVRPVPRLRGARRALPRARGGTRVSRSRPEARGAEQLLVIVAMALVAFGVVMVYSASASPALLEHHAVYAAIGLGALWLLARRDYRHTAALAPSMLVV